MKIGKKIFFGPTLARLGDGRQGWSSFEKNFFPNFDILSVVSCSPASEAEEGKKKIFSIF